jgi:tetratricopeptide (TPR) repeat protein
MGLEFLLGRHAELATHIHVFEILYPDDPSPRYLEAAEFALNGRLQQANAALEPVRESAGPAMWNQQVASLRLMAEAAQYYSVDALLNGGAFDSEKLSQLMASADFPLAANISGGTNGAARLREPHLPCIEHGILDGVAAVQALSVPFFKDLTPAIQKIKSSWEVYPEALVPFRAATILETRQPRTGPKSIPLLAIEAELFQMAADSPSVMPSLQRSSRYLAAKAQSQLIQDQPATSNEMRGLCLQNIQAAAAAVETSAAECGAYLAIAFQLGDYDAARRLLDRWERLAPNDAALAHQQIQLETMAGNFAAALQLLNGILARDPSDPWALDRLEAVRAKLETLIHSVPPRKMTSETPGTIK